MIFLVRFMSVQTCARCVFMHVQLDRSQSNIGFELAFYFYYDRRFCM